MTARSCLALLARSLALDPCKLSPEVLGSSGAVSTYLLPRLWAASRDRRQQAASRRNLVVAARPFGGRCGAACISLFNTAAARPDTAAIAMILPASFSKPSVQRRLHRHFHLRDEMLLPDQAVMIDGRETRLNAVFQIWERRDQPRACVQPQRSHRDFEFVKTCEEADFSLRRIGGRVGAVIDLPDADDDRPGPAPSSNYFIKATGGDPAVLRRSFEALDMSEIRIRSTAHPSLSKPELIALYEAQHVIEAAVLRASAEGQGPTRAPAPQSRRTQGTTCDLELKPREASSTESGPAPVRPPIERLPPVRVVATYPGSGCNVICLSIRNGNVFVDGRLHLRR